MPCYDSRDREPQIIYISGVSPYELEQEKKKSSWLEAALCAMFSELDRRGIAAEVISEASRNGLIGIMDVWQRHNSSDEARIAKILHGYSKDEQEIMRKLLSKNETK